MFITGRGRWGNWDPGILGLYFELPLWVVTQLTRFFSSHRKKSTDVGRNEERKPVWPVLLSASQDWHEQQQRVYEGPHTVPLQNSATPKNWNQVQVRVSLWLGTFFWGALWTRRGDRVVRMLELVNSESTWILQVSVCALFFFFFFTGSWAFTLCLEAVPGYVLRSGTWQCWESSGVGSPVSFPGPCRPIFFQEWFLHAEFCSCSLTKDRDTGKALPQDLHTYSYTLARTGFYSVN